MIPIKKQGCKSPIITIAEFNGNFIRQKNVPYKKGMFQNTYRKGFSKEPSAVGTFIHGVNIPLTAGF
jgi:hypothetical protein